MSTINRKGIVVGTISWIIMMIYTVNKSACLTSETCGSDDLFMTAMLAIGMLAPAWLIANFTSAVFKE